MAKENKEVQERILGVLRKAQPYDVFTINEIAIKVGVIRTTAQRHIYKLSALNEEFNRIAVHRHMESIDREYVVRREVE
jgi:predicted ArsR family transcriptional regulator